MFRRVVSSSMLRQADAAPEMFAVASTEQASGFSPLFYIVLGFLGLGVLFIVWCFRSISKERQAIIDELEPRLEETKNRLYALNQELPPLLSLARGQSLQRLQEMHRRFDKNLHESSAYYEQLYSISKGDKQPKVNALKILRQLKLDIAQQSSDVAEITQQMADYRKLVRSNTEALRDCDSELQDLERLARQRRENQRYVAPGLLNRLTVLRSQWQQAERDHTFDPQRAHAGIEKLPEQIEQLRADFLDSL